MIRLTLLSLLLTSVLLIGLPIGPLETPSSAIQSTLEPFGIDVSMTPITADMTLMRDLYASELSIVGITESGDELVFTPKELTLYEFKLPLILFLEIYSYGHRVPETLWALCHFLKKKDGGVRGFIFRANFDSYVLRKQGINVLHQCHK